MGVEEEESLRQSWELDLGGVELEERRESEGGCLLPWQRPAGPQGMPEGLGG